MFGKQSDISYGSKLFHQLLNSVSAAFRFEVKSNFIGNLFKFDRLFRLMVGNFNDVPADVGLEWF